MTTHAAFLLDVCTHPDDDAPRLIYADWLEEQGEGERAEFIRVQCEFARVVRKGNPEGTIRIVSGDPQRFNFLRRREEELRGRDAFPSWAPPLPVNTAIYHRGFIDSITLSTADFFRHAGSIFRTAPVTDVRLSDRSPYNYSMRSNSSDWAWWYSRHPRENLAPHNQGVPPAIWEQLECDRVVEHWKHYRSSEAAFAALSAACIVFGRKIAGLLPLKEISLVT